MKLIDAHVHVFERIKGFGFAGEMRPVGQGRIQLDTGEVSQMFPAEFGDCGVLAEDFLAFMDREGIDKAVVMQGPAYGYQNQYLAEVRKKYPDRFLPAALIDPESFLFEPILKNLIDNLGFRVFKLEMSTLGGIMGYHSSNTMLHPNMDKLFDAVERVHGTIALDIGGPEESSYQVDRVAALARSHPGLHVLMCHLLEPEDMNLDRLAENLEKLKLDNVWFDISSLPTILKEQAPYEKSLRCIQCGYEIVGAGRLVWGTDAPGSLVRNNYQTLLDVQVRCNPAFTDGEREQILYKNALDVYPFDA